VLTKSRLPLLIGLICCIEVTIYLWSVWTSTFDEPNFFAIQPEFIFDKSARLAGRISAFLVLVILGTTGFHGLRKIYADDKRRNSFMILLTLFTVNHLIHLLFVILRFKSHGEIITLSESINIGGTVHGLISFSFIVIVPFILWKFQHLTKLLYLVIVLHLLNISGFMIKTFLSKIKPPDHPAYHNQLGILVLSAGCLYILYRAYVENRLQLTPNDENNS